MLIYLFQRRIVSKRFEKVRSGYIYRRRPDLEGFEVTDEDRREMLSEFRKLYWRSSGKLVGFFAAAILVFTVLTMTMKIGNNAQNLIAYVIVGAAFALTLRDHARWPLILERRLAKNPKVEPLVSHGGWLARFQAHSRKRTWLDHAIFLGAAAGLAFLLAPANSEASFARWAFFSWIVICLGGAIYAAIHKAMGEAAQ